MRGGLARLGELRRSWLDIRGAAALAWRARPLAACAVVATTIVGGIVPLVVTWLTKALIDDLAQPGRDDPRQFALLGGVLALTAAIAPVVGLIGRYFASELARGIELRTHDLLFRHLNSLPGLKAFESPELHDRLRLAQQGGMLGPTQVLRTGTGIGQSVVTLGGFAVTVALISPLLAGLAIAGLLPSLVSELRLARARTDLAYTLSPHERRKFFYGQLQSDPAAAKELRLFGVGSYFHKRMLGEYRTIADAERRLDRRTLRAQLGTRAVASLAAAAAMGLVVRQGLTGAIGLGDVVAVIAALNALHTLSVGLVLSTAELQRALLLLRHFTSFLQTPSELSRGSRPVPALCDGVELEDVWFRYADDLPWVLRGVSLRIPRGDAVALVGLNGAGKSTLVKLLCRFYDPTRGRILWDGVDLRELDVVQLRERIGAVFQDYMTYDLTAAENVGLGDQALLHDRGRIRRAAALAQVDGSIEALPRGYETVLSRVFGQSDDHDDRQSGAMLSGGQWQRLALARMFMRTTRDLLLLDEPSSGLDVDAEAAVHRRFREQVTEATSVLISHRFSTVRMADRIVIVDNGQVVEHGTHDELIAADGEYARMFELQAAGYAE